MEPSNEPIAVRLTRLNRQILGKVTSGGPNNFNKRTIDREALLDALTSLYDECNEDPVKKCDDLVQVFVDKYRSTLAELRRTRVCIADFETLQTIGRGHFGDVHMVREKQTGDVYAVKQVRKEAAARRGTSAEDERLVLAACSPWLPRLQYAFQDNTNLYLVMELCSGGDLASLLSRSHAPLSEKDAAFYVAEIAHALRALHNLGFVHRDLKPNNVLLDRCGHLKLTDFGSCARLSAGTSGVTSLPAATADYVAPELLAAVECARRHTVCLACCSGVQPTSITACDYWSLGVIAFELVTLKRPFSDNDDDSIPKILSNIQKYESASNPEPPFPPLPEPPTAPWRTLVGGLLRVVASKRYAYLDTLQHSALRHLSPHSIRDQAPPWVPSLRGPEDASYFPPAPRTVAPPHAAPFRARAPFNGQLPFVGFSYVAPDESEDSMSTGFNASHDCTAIDLATFKSAEKLAAMRGREIASLQSKLAMAEATAGAETERTRRAAEDEAERLRARLQAEITALSLQNKRLERQIEIDKEERMALERNIQELTSSNKDRSNVELRKAQSSIAELDCDRNIIKKERDRLQAKVEELSAQCERNLAAADSARAQQRHYKESMAKERAIRRQTLSGYSTESRECGARLAAAEAGVAKEARAREHAENKLAKVELAAKTLQIELDAARQQLTTLQESLSERKRVADASSEELKQVQIQLTQERVRSSTMLAQVQELQREIAECQRRESALEEQCERTEARLQERLQDAESRATDAIKENARHRDKVSTLEQFVRQLEREVGALEARRQSPSPLPPAASPSAPAPPSAPATCDAHSDTESVDGHAHTNTHAHAQVSLLKEQLAKAEAQLQARTEEMAALRQEARSANLARWRKEREFNDLEVTAKTTARELKRLEDRMTAVTELRKTAEQKTSALQTELDKMKPEFERNTKELEATKAKLEKLQKEHEIAMAEVDRSRNDIRKLKCELQYSEKRRLRAEQQEELGGRERALLRDEAQEARALAHELQQNNRALQDACSLLEEQLTDLERLSDLHEEKNKELEKEVQGLTQELSARTSKLQEAEQVSAERAAQILTLDGLYQTLLNQSTHDVEQIQILKERLDSREMRLCELEAIAGALEQEKQSLQAALSRSHRQTMSLQEETAVLRTRAQEHHAKAMELQAELDTAQEEIAAAKEASDAAAAWWRTRETKADATLRQQAKLIDFLQSKIEDTKYKKCSLSTKLFGRSPARSAASPPLRRANRELREEVDRLKRKLATSGKENISCSTKAPATLRPDTSPRPRLKSINGVRSIDTPDGAQNVNELKIIWRDGSSTLVKQARCVEGVLVFAVDGTELRARFLSTDTSNLPHNDAQRSFTIKIENGNLNQSQATVVCSDQEQRASWVSRLVPSPSPTQYAPALLTSTAETVTAAMYITQDALALGTPSGLRSLRGVVRLELDRDFVSGTVASIASCVSRVVLLVQGGPREGGVVLHASKQALVSALRRAPSLHPSLTVQPVHLPDSTPPGMVQTISCDTPDGPILAVAAGRRVFLLRYDASTADFKLSRSLTVDRPPYSLLLTTPALYIAGERPLKINLPSGALESFAMENPTVAAAVKKHTSPKQLLLIRDNPVEILICYSECGIFVGENGKKTRTEDPKWPIAVNNWAYVNPFLYLVGKDGVTINYITEDSYRAPPCTCETDSIASSDGCSQETTFNLKLKDPQYLGTTPNGIMVRSQVGCEYAVSVVEGMAAFRSVGASVESLATLSDAQGSTTSLAPSTDCTPSEATSSESSRNESLRASIESVEPPTRFLADIRQRAEELRQKNSQHSVAPQDVIKAIMTTEVKLRRLSRGRQSPSTISEGSEHSDTSAENTNNVKTPADLCAEMFTKQVKFQKNVS